jgi:hypothetical protein
MLRSTFAVVAAASAAPTTGIKPAQAVAWTAIPPPRAVQEHRFTDIWDDSAWTTTSRPAAVIRLPSASTLLHAASDSAAGPAGPATAADALTPVHHSTH